MLSYKFGICSFQNFKLLWIFFSYFIRTIGVCRFLSKSKWHVMIQVNATESTVKLGNSEVSLRQDIVQFGCKNNQPIGDTTLFNFGEMLLSS